MKNYILCLLGVLMIQSFLLTNVLFAQSPKIKYDGPKIYSAGTDVTPLIPVNTGGIVASNGYRVSTFAGSGAIASNDGTGVEAGFYYPMGVAVDSAGYVYVVDRHNNKIRKISPSGKVTTWAGSGIAGNSDGKGAAASFNWPYGIDLDVHGNAYVTDRYNNTIRKITPDGTVSTFAGSGAVGSVDGVGTAASFNWPTGIALDSAGNILVADTYNNLIRKITPAGEVTTIAGTGAVGTTDGAALQATFNVPTGLEPDASGTIWIADVNNNMIRKISAAGIVSTVAGTPERRFADGTGAAAGFFFPYSLIMDPAGDFLVADANNNRIRKVTKDGVVTTIAGYGPKGSEDGEPTESSFSYPADVAYDASGNIYVADAENNMIRKIAPKYFSINPLLPTGLSFDYSTGVISGKPLKGSPTTTYRIIASNASGTDSSYITLSVLDTPVLLTLPVTSIEGKAAVGNGTFTNIGYPYPTSYGVCYSTTGMPTVDSLKTNNGTDSIAGPFATKMTGLQLNTRYIVRAYAISTLGTTYGDTVSFTTTGPAPEIDYAIKEHIFTAGVEITPLTLTVGGGAILPFNNVDTYAGNGNNYTVDGTLATASFNNPYGIASGPSGDIYVTDAFNLKIRKITPEGNVVTFAGSGSYGSTDGAGTIACFRTPIGLAVDLSGNVYVADANGHKIRKITKDGVVSTLAGSGSTGSTDGTGSAASFYDPTGVAVDSMGNVFVADYYNNKIRKITSAGVVTTFAGSGNSFSGDGTGTSASFYGPFGIAIDASGTLFVAEADGNKIRRITSAGVVTTLAGSGNFGFADGTGTWASFNNPTGIAIDSKGNILVADRGNHRIRKVTPSGVVSTLAGTNVSGLLNGDVTTSKFNGPSGVCVDAKGLVFVADQGNSVIRSITSGKFILHSALPIGLKLDSETGTISGTPVSGSATAVYSVIASNLGGRDTASIQISVNGKPSVTTQSAYVINATKAEAFGNLLNPGFPISTNTGICWNKTGLPSINDNIVRLSEPISTSTYRCELNDLSPGTDYYVRAYSTNSYGTTYGNVLHFFTPELAPYVQYFSPIVLTVGTEMNPLKPQNAGGKLSPFDYVSTFAGTGVNQSIDGPLATSAFAGPAAIAADGAGNLYVSDADVSSNKIRKISAAGVVSTLVGSAAGFNSPRGLAADSKGNVFVADTYNNKVCKIDKDGVVTTLAGSGASGNATGMGASASFNYPMGLAVDTTGNVYVADKNNNRICKITPEGMVSVLAGGTKGTSDGVGTDAFFNQPSGVAVDASGTVFVADYGNHKIRKITPTGAVTTFVGANYTGQNDGSGTLATFYYPIGITFDKKGALLVADYGNHKIRKITPEGVVSTLAGKSYYSGYVDGKANSAQFAYPTSVAVDTSGLVYIVDIGYNKIRKIGPAYYSISPSLPAGLNFDVRTGVISGKPTMTYGLNLHTVYSFNSGGYCYSDVVLSVSESSVGIDDLSSKSLTVFPNPANNQICLNGLKDKELVTVYTLTGVKLFSKEVSNGEMVDISRLNAGVYLVKVAGKEFKLVKK